MKILFIDIDGVLNCMNPTPSRMQHEWTCIDERRYGLNPELVARLRYIMGSTGCKLVVSSSWRHHFNYAPWRPNEDWRDVLAEMLHKDRDDVFAGETSSDPKGRRGIEISNWILDHLDTIEGVCIVDDETSDITPYVNPELVVKTDMNVGLTKADADKIIDKLKKTEL